MARSKDPSDTPVMRQYLTVKETYPDAILFYRLGDFYEMFFEDAVIASQKLDLVLTSRNKNDPEPIPMCGVPHHAALGYVAKLIDCGHKVAICDQMEDPSKVKGLVKREVVRVITPGVVLDDESLESKANNFLAAVMPVGEGDAFSAAVAVIDASTYEFKGTRVSGLAELAGEIFRLEPREILVEKSSAETLGRIGELLPRCCVTEAGEDLFSENKASEILPGLLGHDDTKELISADPLLARAAGAAASYVRATRPKGEVPITRFVRYRVCDRMVIDEATKSHLELVRTVSGEKKGSLLWLVDRTRTAMGGRMLRYWINYPLVDVGQIRRRLDRVELFFRDSGLRDGVLQSLAGIADLERIAARVGIRDVAPRDLGTLRNSLKVVPDINALFSSCKAPDKDEILGGDLDCVAELADRLTDALADEPPVGFRDGGIFREGFDASLDDLVKTANSSKDFIASIEARERKRTGIASLKVSFNKVFGYYIEVSKSNLKRVPPDFVRKQTLVAGERFVTPELEEWEVKVLSADERRRELETDLFFAFVDEVGACIPRLLALSRRVAEIDCAASLAETARRLEFVRPDVDSSGVVDIVEGRHPLVEAMQTEAQFVPNDVKLDPNEERMLIITGPNMAGKSTVMRQVALMVILAQTGSFVPAAKASIGVCDRLFSRVGASDNIVRGASTFMVEMNETSAILRGATRDSLVIVDEVGRGTSTYDGLSIAWAVGEYLHDTVGCKVMFATHFHELIDLARVKEHAANYHVAAREYENSVVFLRKLVKGGTSHSFGIQVARMAGLPEIVVQRAKDVLKSLESERPARAAMPDTARCSATSTNQLDLFSSSQRSEVERVVEEIDLNRLTPMEALSLLARLKKMSDKK